MTAALPPVRDDQLMIVVPTYNERENLAALVAGVAAALPGAHILVVDDDSPDGTADLARELKTRHPTLDLLVRKGARGLGGALVAGFKEGVARGHLAVGSMDCDLSHDPATLPAMLAKLQDHDLVTGSRYIAGGGTVGWGAHRKLLSWTANRFAATLLGLRLSDVTTNFRVVRAPLLRSIDLDGIVSTGYSFQVEILHRLIVAGARVAEQPIVFHDRRAGVSKMSAREVRNGVLHLMRLRSTLGRSAPPR